MEKIGHLLDLGQYVTHGLSSVSIFNIFEEFGLWPTLIGSDQHICRLNLDFKSDSGMYA